MELQMKRMPECLWLCCAPVSPNKAVSVGQHHHKLSSVVCGSCINDRVFLWTVLFPCCSGLAGLSHQINLRNTAFIKLLIPFMTYHLLLFCFSPAALLFFPCGACLLLLCLLLFFHWQHHRGIALNIKVLCSSCKHRLLIWFGLVCFVTSTNEWQDHSYSSDQEVCLVDKSINTGKKPPAPDPRRHPHQGILGSPEAP